jgi:transposase
MMVTVHEASEASSLRELIRTESDAKQRDRFRAVLLAIEGESGVELEGDQIALRVGRSPRFVDQWLARYRRGGLAALYPRKAQGRPKKLAADAEPAFKARLLGGPTPADGGVCTLRGAEAMRILKGEFGVEMKLSGVYALMHRLNLACLKPRPRHRTNDPKAAADWLDRAPLLPGN